MLIIELDLVTQAIQQVKEQEFLLLINIILKKIKQQLHLQHKFKIEVLWLLEIVMDQEVIIKV